jgi:hypothetical protein
MDSSIAAIRPDVVAVQTTPRPTPTPIRVQFSEVLAGGARALVRSAETVLRALPGSPLMAVALRGGVSGVPEWNVLSGTLPASTQSTSWGATTAPQGPGGSSAATHSLGAAAIVGSGTGVGAAAGAGPATVNDGSVEGALAQDQQLNLYYLQIQEQVNAQNRTFSALSNVLEVEHNTAKTAIGNIH